MIKKIGVTIGDPAGIGPEIVLKALANHPEIYDAACPIVFGCHKILEAQRKRDQLDVQLINLSTLDNLPEIRAGVIPCFYLENISQIPEPGKISATAGKLSYQFIKQAVEQTLAGKIDAIATAPINKEAFKKADVPYLDHTELLAKLTNSSHTMTLFMTGSLRIFFYSRHLAFKDIPAALNKNDLTRTLSHCHKYLMQIGISKPRLALAALNPHGGEGGMFGDEEIDILIPAVQAAQKNGLNVKGPIAADSVFHLAKEGHFDGVLSLYHDQGHIAAKTFDFHRTISMTMGLPFLRTSVDHGTAMDMAGKNRANETSMVEAIKAAAR